MKINEIYTIFITILLLTISLHTIVLPTITYQKSVSASETSWEVADTTTGTFGITGNAYTDNGVYDRGAQDTYVIYSGFDLITDDGGDIASGAEIQGIEVKVNGKSKNVYNLNVDCKLSWDTGSSWTSVQTETLTNTEQDYIWGTTSDDWGRTWTLNDLSSSKLRVNFTHAIDRQELWIDLITIRITYSLSNYLPDANSFSPYAGEEEITSDTTELSVYMYDAEGDSINYTIETQPDIGSQYNWSSEDSNGTKTCIVSGLADDTTYTWWVNMTDYSASAANTSSKWTSQELTFSTTTSYCNVEVGSLSDTYSTPSVTITADEIGALDPDSVDLYYRYSPYSYQDIFVENSHSITIQTPEKYSSMDYGFYVEEWFTPLRTGYASQENDVLIDEGIIYTTSVNSRAANGANAYAIYAGNGTIIWNVTYDWGSYSGMVMDDNYIYIPVTEASTNGEGGILCLYKSNGTEKWNFEVIGGVTMGFVVDSDNGFIYAHASRDASAPLGKYFAIHLSNGTLAHNLSGAEVYYSACSDLFLTYGGDNYYIVAPDDYSSERIRTFKNPHLSTSTQEYYITIASNTWDTKLFSGDDSSVFYAQFGDADGSDGKTNLSCFYTENGTLKWHVNAFGLVSDIGPSIDNNIIYTFGELNNIIHAYAYFANNGTEKWDINLTILFDTTVWDTEDLPVDLHVNSVTVGRDSILFSFPSEYSTDTNGYLLSLKKTDGSLEVMHPLNSEMLSPITIHGGNAYFVTNDGDYEGIHSIAIGNGSYSNWTKYHAHMNNSGAQPSDWTDHHYVDIAWSNIDADENRMILTNNYPFTVEDITIEHRDTGGNLVLTDWYNYSDDTLYHEDSNSFTVGLEPYQVLDLRLQNDATSGTASYTKPTKETSYGWTKFGTDSTSPWSWEFDNPKGDGYYEFYAQGFNTSDDEVLKNIPEKRYKYTLTYEILLTNGQVDSTSGVAGYTEFNFSVVWTSANGLTPDTGSIKVEIDDGDVINHNYTMVYVSGDVTTGALYRNITTLETGSEWEYIFWAYNDTNNVRNHTTIVNNPDVSAQSYDINIVQSHDSMWFNFTNIGGGNSQSDVGALGQTSVTPALTIQNTGNVPIDIDISCDGAFGTGITLKWDEDNNPTGATTITTSPVEFVANLVATDTKNIWLWMDFVSVQGGTGSQTLSIDSRTGSW